MLQKINLIPATVVVIVARMGIHLVTVIANAAKIANAAQNALVHATAKNVLVKQKRTVC